jgi:hypothetical protein
MGRARAWAVWVALAAPLAAAGQEWETVERGPIVVKVRSIPGTASREVWAEGELDAEVQDLQTVILDSEGYPRFMPYVKETRVLETSADGARLVYTRLEPPFISARDYVVRAQVGKLLGPDGRGEFSNSWRSVPDRLPRRNGVVRLPICDGSWTVSRAASGRARVVYRASVDPGSWVPGFISDMANRTGALHTLRAVEREARRRAEARRAQAANDVQRQPRSTP